MSQLLDEESWYTEYEPSDFGDQLTFAPVSKWSIIQWWLYSYWTEQQKTCTEVHVSRMMNHEDMIVKFIFVILLDRRIW